MRPAPKLRLVVNAKPREFTIASLLEEAPFAPHSDHCPSLFDIEAVRPDSICWSQLQEELGWLAEQGVVVRKPNAPSGYAPVALEPPLIQRIIAARRKR